MKKFLIKYKKHILYLLLIGLGVFVFTFLVTTTWIGLDVKTNCKEAKIEYGSNLSCSEALINVLEDENKSFQERNSAIWALGQLGDSNALPFLEKYYTGNIPEKEPYDEGISQHELKKAINLVKGGANITAFIWRHELP